MGFDDAEEKKATEMIELDPQALVSGAVIPLTFVRYQFVDNISVFIPENNGNDITSISYLGFLGEPVASMDMSDFKAQG